MSYPEDPFPDTKPYPDGLDFWERDHLSGLHSQVSMGQGASHVALLRPNTNEIAGAKDLPGEAIPALDERQYFWSGDKLWNRDGSPLDADELASQLSGTVADVNDPGSGDGTVAFDIFSGQTGGEYTSSAVVVGGQVTDYTIALPYINLDNYVTKYKFIQLRWFLKDVPLLQSHNTATIRGGVPYLYHGREKTPSVESGALADLVDDIVSTYVNESTADTLDQYPEEY